MPSYLHTQRKPINDFDDDDDEDDFETVPTIPLMQADPTTVCTPAAEGTQSAPTTTAVYSVSAPTEVSSNRQTERNEERENEAESEDTDEGACDDDAQHKALMSEIASLKVQLETLRLELKHARAPAKETALAVGAKAKAPAPQLTSITLTPYAVMQYSLLVGSMCDNCHKFLFPADWYHCNVCPDYDLCAECLQLADGVHARGGSPHSFADMAFLIQTDAGFPRILNMMSVWKRSFTSYTCSVCSEPACFHCNVCPDYVLCETHILASVWHSHAAHGTDTTFTNLHYRHKVKGI